MRIYLLTLFACLPLSFACSGTSSSTGTTGGAVATCTSAPKSCPADVPSYSQVVKPIIATSCASASCHSTSGDAPDVILTDLADIQHWAQPSLTETAACQMPPDGTPMSAEDRTALLTWYTCMAPDN